MADLNKNFREKKFLIETLLSKKQHINIMRRPLIYYGKIVEKYLYLLPLKMSYLIK